jgi:protein-tyrosine phosphatase
VCHCSGGVGRGPLGLGVWLADTYGLSAADAVAAIKGVAAEARVDRQPSEKKLAQLLAEGQLQKKAT